MLGQQREDLLLVLGGLQRNRERAHAVGLAGIEQPLAPALALRALAERQAAEVEQVLGLRHARRHPGLAQQLGQLAAQARQRRLPVVGAIARRLELLQQLDQALLEVVGSAVAQARHEPLDDPAAQAEGDLDDELRSCPLGLGRHRARRRGGHGPRRTGAATGGDSRALVSRGRQPHERRPM